MQQKQRPASGKIGRFLLAQEMDREIAKSDLDTWIESMGDDPDLKGLALAITGLLTNDPDLIREGIATDPDNPQLLFIGANFNAFDAKERLELSKRLMEADPDNALAAYMTASRLMAAGNQQDAMDILKASDERSLMNDFSNKTQLLMEEALIASGLSPGAASIRSAFDMDVSYLIEMRGLANTMEAQQGSMTAEDAAESRRLAANMGYRLSSQTGPTTVINQLAGIALELSTLEGLPDDSPSPYQGLTVGQARQNILAEQERTRAFAQQLGNHHNQLMSNPDLLQRYIQYYRMAGEVEAARWLQRTLEPDQ